MVQNNQDTLKKKFEELSQNLKTPHLKPVINRFIEMLEAKALPIEFFETAIPLINVIDNEMDRSPNSANVLNDLYRQKGAFNQPAWDVNNVYQNYGPQYNMVLNNYLDKPTIVPILLLVVTDKEKNELMDEKIFDGINKENLKLFRSFKAQLENSKDSFDCYGKTPKDWKPLLKNGDCSTIIELIDQVVESIKTDYNKKILLEYIDVRSLNNNNERGTLLDLRENGCIVIMDIFSMHHSGLSTEFIRSFIDGFPKTSIITISPSPSVSLRDITNQIAIKLTTRVSEMEFVKRKCEDRKRRIAETNDKEAFKEWFKRRCLTEFGFDFQHEKNIFNF